MNLVIVYWENGDVMKGRESEERFVNKMTKKVT